MVTLIAGHPDVSVPSDDTKIWHYMNFTKFAAMILNRTLYFPRADQFKDDWEGVIPRWLIDWLDAKVSMPDWAQGKTFAQHFREVELARQYVYCWHRNPNESAAMWKIYGQTEEAVAIESSVGRLRQSMQNSRIREIDRQVFQFKIGNVEYGDHTTWQPPSKFSGDVYTFPFFFKRLSFEYEQEFRVKLDGAHELNGIAPLPECVNVEVDVPALIEHIYVAPKAPDRFKELVIELLQQCGIENSRSLVTRTALDAPRLM